MMQQSVPAGPIPKDGSSPAPNLAMTGEITPAGQVMPVGGIQEKAPAAKRNGVRELILPAENEVNVNKDLKTEQIGEIEIHFVKTMKNW